MSQTEDQWAGFDEEKARILRATDHLIPAQQWVELRQRLGVLSLPHVVDDLCKILRSQQTDINGLVNRIAALEAEMAGEDPDDAPD